MVSHLVVAPEDRGGAAGALLIRTLLSGPQALTFSDSSTPGVLRIWRLFGGQADATRGVEYMLVTRPDRWVRGIAGELVRRRPISHRLVPVEALPLHAVGSRVLSRARPSMTHSSTPGLTSGWTAPASLADMAPGPDNRVRVPVAHDAVYFQAHSAQFSCMAIGRYLVRRFVGEAGRRDGGLA